MTTLIPQLPNYNLDATREAVWTTLDEADNAINLEPVAGLHIKPEHVMLLVEISNTDEDNVDDNIGITIDGNPTLANPAIMLLPDGTDGNRYLFGPFPSNLYRTSTGTIAFHFDRPPADSGTRAMVIYRPR